MDRGKTYFAVSRTNGVRYTKCSGRILSVLSPSEQSLRRVLKAQASLTSAICLPKLGHSFLTRNKNSQGRGGKFAQSFRSECHYDCAVPSGRNTSEMMHFSSTQALHGLHRNSSTQLETQVFPERDKPWIHRSSQRTACVAGCRTAGVTVVRHFRSFAHGPETPGPGLSACG